MSNYNYANPYQAPSQFGYQPRQLRLASRPKRFAGALIDNFTLLLSFLPGVALFIGGPLAADPKGGPDAIIPFLISGLGLMFIGVLTVLAIQTYLLATSSQSIGKYLLKMQVIDFNTHQRSPFVQCCLLRSLIGVYLLNQVPFYGIVDACFIFREDYRCLHDLIGNSIVVDLDP
jgi:uncharacterized RDD family membrane protein YckC